MNFFLVYKSNIKNSIIEKLNELEIDFTQMDDIINLNGKELSVQAYEQIKKRDTKNPHVLAFKREILKIQISKIEESDAILVFNEIDLDSLFQIIIAYYLNKHIYFYDKINSNSQYVELISAFNPIYLKGDLSKIMK